MGTGTNFDFKVTELTDLKSYAQNTPYQAAANGYLLLMVCESNEINVASSQISLSFDDGLTYKDYLIRNGATHASQGLLKMLVYKNQYFKYTGASSSIMIFDFMKVGN